ncbi:DUF3489 domain-containing protein [Hyphomicrobium sp.]|uniref:DUF3489 domain-containing protein n=1 Tax=Hyphomicrobium sp. TaxID=82 RepID=UPI001D7F0E16|nr:DUF3489 domain-containing protein [Hyphomicrobium sp.]MBY0558592.1 DUF3489 domain-containing protein [Hyphomicrobium sp.]
MARIAQSKSRAITLAQTVSAAKAVPPAPRVTKSASLIALLKTKRGATLPEMMKATGWQQHSVRGFLAGTLKKRHGLEAISEKPEDGPRRYRLR